MYCVVLRTSTWGIKQIGRISFAGKTVHQTSKTMLCNHLPPERRQLQGKVFVIRHRYQTNSLTRKHINLASNDDSISSLFSGAILHNNTINININPQFAESKQHQPRRNNKFIIYDSDDDE